MSDPGKAVFLSYASQDKEVAKRICEALQAAGLEVWFDQSELRGGDSWDQKIRRQIKECALFVPLITPNTNARPEGYFRLEWKLAVDRSHLMADDQPFLFPIVVGEVNDATARVPDKFRDVQWTRVRLDESPAELAARMARLLSEGGPSSREAFGDAASQELGLPGGRRDRRQRSGLERWWWLIFPVMGMAVPIIKQFQEPSSQERPLPPAPPSAISTPDPKSRTPEPKMPSEARALVARARALSLDKYNSTADDFAAAEGLIKRAIELDGNDGEIWAVSSLFNSLIRTRGYDFSPARRELARSQAERALTLAPDSIEARYALGRWQRDNESDPAIAERTLLDVLARNPEHAGALQSLGTFYQRAGRPDEAIAMFERAARLPGQVPLARFGEFLTYFGRARFDEAEQAVRASIAADPSSNSVCGLAMLLLTRGDAAGAVRAFDALPTVNRNEHRAVWVQAFAQLVARQPDEALKTLDRLSADFIQDNWFTGPKAYWVGRAHLQAGRPEAARVALEAGLVVAEKQLKEIRGTALRVTYGEMLAMLGRKEEALREVRTLAELYRAPQIIWTLNSARIEAWIGRADEAAAGLEPILPPNPIERLGWPLTPALLRLDPLWDKVRDKPRFQKLCENPPRDWPKNPELKKAVSMLDRYDCIPEDLRLAEEIAQAALDKAPTDQETVTVMARVQVMWSLRGWDRSSERNIRMQRVTERAVKLAPDEPEALAALALSLNPRGPDRFRARQLLERAVELAPGEPRFHRWRNELIWGDSTVPREEVFAAIERMLALFPHDALVHYDASRHYRIRGRFEESEREIDATLAIAPVANALAWKARMEFGLRNNLGGMKAALDRVPGRVRNIERTVFGYFVYAVMSGDYRVGVEAFTDLIEPWMIDFDYRGPKALPLAALLELQGKPALARIQYEIALKDMKQRQASEPDDLFLKLVEAWALHGLGRDDEARAAIRVHNESLERPYRINQLNSWWFHPIAGNLLLGERATALALIREAAEQRVGRATVSRFLASDPRLTAFRDDPEIKALLAEPTTEKK